MSCRQSLFWLFALVLPFRLLCLIVSLSFVFVDFPFVFAECVVCHCQLRLLSLSNVDCLICLSRLSPLSSSIAAFNSAEPETGSESDDGKTLCRKESTVKLWFKRFHGKTDPMMGSVKLFSWIEILL